MKNLSETKLNTVWTEKMLWSFGNFDIYEILISKDIFPEKDFLEKTATIKIFEYFLFYMELKPQASAADNQCQVSNKIFNSDETGEPVTNQK